MAGRLIDNSRAGLAALLGPRRPGLKLAAIALVGTTLLLAMAKGEHRVTARSFLEPEISASGGRAFRRLHSCGPGAGR